MELKHFKAIVNNGQSEWDLRSDELHTLDLFEQPDGEFHILIEGKAFRATLKPEGTDGRHFRVRVNGALYHVALKDEYGLLIERLGLSTAAAHKIDTVYAPMPGLVLQIAVAAGQTVSKGDTLLILEAMKMENVIKSPADGVIRDVVIRQGQAVEKGQPLVGLD